MCIGSLVIFANKISKKHLSEANTLSTLMVRKWKANCKSDKNTSCGCTNHQNPSQVGPQITNEITILASGRVVEVY